MNVIKEYYDEKTKIRVHDDYIEDKNSKETKELIIGLIINFLKNKNSQLQ